MTSPDDSPCMDCGTATTPCADPDRCWGPRGCRHDGAGRWEWYMVWAHLWDYAVGAGARGYLCVGCLQRRLGRPLTADDFTAALVNVLPSPWQSPRLAAARRRVSAVWPGA